MPQATQKPAASGQNIQPDPVATSATRASAPERPERSQDAPARSSSVEEQAIRAAFLAQLSSSELLAVVRDPADRVLPDTPDAVA